MEQKRIHCSNSRTHNCDNGLELTMPHGCVIGSAHHLTSMPRSDQNVMALRRYAADRNCYQRTDGHGRRKVIPTIPSPLRGVGLTHPQKTYRIKQNQNIIAHNLKQIYVKQLFPRWGLLLKERICSRGEQILSFKNSPYIICNGEHYYLGASLHCKYFTLRTCVMGVTPMKDPFPNE